jgi:5'-methylthioadenosine phosphorylase
MTKQHSHIAIIGGSGVYSIDGLKVTGEHSISTPFGDPSDAIIEGELGGVPVAFLPRHGRGHRILPSEVNSRANIYALKTLGVKWCIGVSATGSLSEEITPGMLVVPDQIIDRTYLRKGTFFGDGVVAHVSMAEPYCPVLRHALAAACTETGHRSGFGTHIGGTYVCMEGPAFSTRAESNMHRSWGAKLIGMTAQPEARLAREAEIAYATLAIATDYDCWKEDEAHVDVGGVIAILTKSVAFAREVLAALIPKLPKLEPSSLAAHSLDNAIMTDLRSAPKATVERLKPLIKRVM